MSDTTTGPSSGKRVNLDKGTATAKPSVPRPRTIEWTSLAVVALILFTLAEAVSWFGFTDEFRKLLVENNDKLSAKDRKVPYTAAQITDDLHKVRIGRLSQAVIVALAAGLLLAALRRTRSAPVARWALIAVMVLTSGPAMLVPRGSLPTVPAVLLVLIGVASTAAIVLLLVPESARYFKECKAVNNAGRAGGGLFGSRLAPGGAAAATRPASRPVARASARPHAAKPAGAAKTKAKARTDEAAVAKGAELARSRAKSNKSRRTEG